jgi:hypothetical protein
MATRRGDKCPGCGVKAVDVGQHPTYQHLPGCRWDYKHNKPGRKPGGQAVRL